MKKNKIYFFLFLILAVIAAFIITDRSRQRGLNIPEAGSTQELPEVPADRWHVYKTYTTEPATLRSIAYSSDGFIAAGGEDFITIYDLEFNAVWSKKTDEPVTALSVRDKIIFAALRERIILFDHTGNQIDEWGPYMPEGYITSISSNKDNTVIADAVNKTVFVLDNKGAVVHIIGRGEERFTIPSLFFDVCIDREGFVYIANTGMKRIEKRHTDGRVISQAGEPGNDPSGFAGCCNPSHFVLYKDGYITAEKGINRIKIIDKEGKFIEFVSGNNSFERSVPLDIAIGDEDLIYAAYPAESTIYVFRRNPE